MQKETKKLLEERIFNLTQKYNKLKNDRVSLQEIELELSETQHECAELDNDKDDLINDKIFLDKEIIKLEKEKEKLLNHVISRGQKIKEFKKTIWYKIYKFLKKNNL